jgi:DNA-binding MarR family transcriptional regulator
MVGKPMTAKHAKKRNATTTPLEVIAGLGSGTEFDRLIHERLRLGIVSALSVNDALTFIELKNILKTSDGNLSVHARKLEEAGYVECTKGFDGRVPRTDYRITAAGRKALQRYLKHMEALIQSVSK